MRGGDKKNSLYQLDLATFSWTSLLNKNKFSCLEHLQWLSGQDNFVRNAIGYWLREQSKVPSHMWYRPSGQMADRTQQNMGILSLASFYQDFSEPEWNDDPKKVQQKALPFILLDELAKHQVIEMDIALEQLSISTAFFACCSCEYLMVPRQDEKQTKLLFLWNIRFFKNGYLTSAPSAELESADSVAITFKIQKNEQKHDTVINWQTYDATLCPVLQWACIFNQIQKYRCTTQNTPVCAAWRHNRLENITSKQVFMALQATSTVIRSTHLGFKQSKIGTHSLCS